MKTLARVCAFALAACAAAAGVCLSADAGGASARSLHESRASKNSAAPGVSPQEGAFKSTTAGANSFAQAGAKDGDASAKVDDAGAKKSDAKEVDPTSVYRVGVGDVLDIRLLDAPRTRRSTLFSVQEGGLLDYPLAGRPRVVAGLTTEEIAAQLAGSFKLRSLFPRPPRLVVSVREYASHIVTVEGLVSEPGAKIIRREAVPLYVVVADAQPRREAGAAVVRRGRDGSETEVDLSDLPAMKMPVHAGDTVVLTKTGERFFDIEGLVARPGRKEFHAGLTLTQAIIAAGGVTERKSLNDKQLAQLFAAYGLPAGQRSSYLAVIARRGADDATRRSAYSLKEIEEGRAPDPVLRPGDRVLVIH